MSGTPEIVASHPASVVVLHGQANAFHYPRYGPSAWEGVERLVPWADFRHLDERHIDQLLESLESGGAHTLVLASGTLQSPIARQLVQSREFGRALGGGLDHGLSIVILMQYLGRGETLRIGGLPARLGGSIVHIDSGQIPDDPLGNSSKRAYGFDGATLEQLNLDVRRHLRDSRDGGRIWAAWRPDRPDQWTVQSTVEHADAPHVILGYTEAGRVRVTYCSLPIDRWRLDGLLAQIVGRSLRTRGLLVLETLDRPVEADVELALVRRRHVNAGGFSAVLRPQDLSALDWDDPRLLAFRHVVVSGRRLDELQRLSSGVLERRLENAGSVTGRFLGPSGTTSILTMGGLPQHVRLGQQLADWSKVIRSDPRKLLTFEFLALARLARAIEARYGDAGAVPPTLRLPAIRRICEEPLLRRIGPDGSVDGLRIPTAAVAATISTLGISGSHGPAELLARLDGLRGDPEEGPQLEYYRALCGLVGASDGGGVPDSAPDHPTLWSALTSISAHRRPPAVEEFLAFTRRGEDDLATALLVLGILEADLDSDGALVGQTWVVEHLQRMVASGLRGRAATLESQLLSAAALLRLSARHDLAFGTESEDDAEVAWSAGASAGKVLPGSEADEAILTMGEMVRHLRRRAHEQDTAWEARAVDAIGPVRTEVLLRASVGTSVLGAVAWFGLTSAYAGGLEAFWAALGTLLITLPLIGRFMWIRPRPFGRLGLAPAQFLATRRTIVDRMRPDRAFLVDED
jgi:hypothetical protein